MSFQAMAWAIKQRTGHPTRKMILMSIANYANDHGSCFPAQALIAEEVECSERMVRKCLEDLEAKGLITRAERRRIDGTRTSDMITLPALVNQPAQRAGSNGINRHRKSDQPAQRAGYSNKNEPITEPITKRKNFGNGFRALSETLANVIDGSKAREPERKTG